MEEKADLKTKNENTANSLFFNVMPKQNLTSQIISPSIKIEENNQSAEQPTKQDMQEIGVVKNFLLTYKKVIIIIFTLLVLATGGYFGYSKYIEKQYKAEDILIKKPNPDTNNPSAPNQNNDEINPAVEGVSTPKEWQKSYFKNENCSEITLCGDEADPDLDGFKNIEEFKATTDPNNEDSDLDGLSDGDEAKVFETDAMNKHTANDPKYDDLSFVKDGYDVKTGKLYSEERLKEIKALVAKYSLHAKTVTSLGDVSKTLYDLGNTQENNTKTIEPKSSTTTPTSTANSVLDGFDQDPEKKLERDTQRQNTIKNIGMGLVRYHQDQKEYPKTQNFSEMYQKIRLYIKVAVNINDPVNKAPYIYTYTLNSTGDEFTLTYFSESLNTIIKKKTADSEKDRIEDDAVFYDNQRMLDLNSLQMALKLYSDGNIAGNQEYVFPSKDKYKTELVPNYINNIPTDPKTKEDYAYEVSDTFDSFTLKTAFDKPKTGKTGYLCNQEECRDY